MSSRYLPRSTPKPKVPPILVAFIHQAHETGWGPVSIARALKCTKQFIESVLKLKEGK